MKKEWETKSLGNLFKISMGKTPSRSNSDYWDKNKTSNNIWVSIADLTAVDGKEIFDSKEYISDIGAKLFKSVTPGTLLVSFKLSLGKLAFAGTELRTNEAVAALENDEAVILNTYLYHYLRFFDWDDYASDDHKVKGKTLNKEKVQNIRISYPLDKNEQKRIVGVLDEKFGVIEELKKITEQQIVDAKELFESRLNEVFASPDYNFGNLGDSVQIKTGKLNSNAAVVDGKYPFFTCSREASKIDSYSFDCDAVLLAGNNASADFNVKHYKGKFDAYQRTYVITVLDEDNLDIRFVYNLLTHGLVKLKESAVGAGTKFLKIGMIQNFQLPQLSLATQKKLIKELDELSEKTKALEAVCRQKIADLQELKKSYLEQAFAGKL